MDRYAGPVLIYDIEQIRANMVGLAEAFGGDPDRILFAVKSFPAPPILTMALEVGAGFEVSNEQEYHLLPKDLTGKIVSLNSPLNEDPRRFLKLGNQLHVHLDAPPEGQLRSYRPDCCFSFRLSHKSLPIDTSLLVEEDRPSRFGASWETFLDSAPFFRNGVLSGIHLHNGSEANTPAFYLAALRVILNAAVENGIPMRRVNLGGGFHPIPKVELNPLLGELCEIAGDLSLFIEPGYVLCRDAGFLLCKVSDVRPFGNQRYQVILDTSYDCHAKWSHPSWSGPKHLKIVKLPHRKIPAPEKGFQILIFTGATCYERDQLGIFRVPQLGSTAPVKPGDPILLSNLNGYSYAWNTGFNGVSPARIRFV